MICIFSILSLLLLDAWKSNKLFHIEVGSDYETFAEITEGKIYELVENQVP